MQENLMEIESDLKSQLSSIDSLDKLEAVRISFLGKNGIIAQKMAVISTIPPEQKKEFGAKINQVKSNVSYALENKKIELEEKQLREKLQNETVDVTLPARSERTGSIHPISQTIDEIIAIFGSMGFSVAEGPDIENDFNNFTALNIPPEHPARQMHDTFYLNKQVDGRHQVLRTHTSPVQIRTMLGGKPPFKIIAPGRTYRSDSDITHSPMFHQVEALYIDKAINMGHLKGCISEFISLFFGSDSIPIRFRPSFFPFTEPSAEVDVGCSWENGELKIGKGKSWLELGGCGMVHQNVLKNCNINPDEYSGFAFGFGVERMAMLKYGIPDVRSFFESDIRWLRHYGFASLNIPNLAYGI